MSKGISQRQRVILRSLLHRRTLVPNGIVAWKDIDDYPTEAEIEAEANTDRVDHPTHEQSLRRALRSLQRRGLVTLARYSFEEEPRSGAFGLAYIYRIAHDPMWHVTGKMRLMTGVTLTEAGARLVAED